MQFMGTGPGHIGSLRPYPTDYTDIGPRLGFAWQTTRDTVIRGAFGVIYEGIGNGGCGCTDGYGGGTFAQTGDGFDPAFSWDKNPNGSLAFSRRLVLPALSRLPASITSAQAIRSFMGPHFG